MTKLAFNSPISELNYERFHYPCPLVQKRFHIVYDKLAFGSSDLELSMRYDCCIWSKVRLFVRSSAGRNRINVLGVVNALTKEVITLQNTTYINAETIVEFLNLLRSKTPLEKSITIICDNARYQHCNMVIEHAKLLNIKMLFLPSYSPNLNIIERLWKFTKKKVLHAKYYEKPELFHQAINHFMENINENHIQELNNLLTLNF